MKFTGSPAFEKAQAICFCTNINNMTRDQCAKLDFQKTHKRKLR